MTYTLSNGKTVRIPDKEIEKNMKILEISKDEAILLYLEDEGYIENAEQEALCKKAKENMSDFFSRKKQKDTPKEAETPIELIKKLAELRDAGIISDEEFELKKAELLSKI